MGLLELVISSSRNFRCFRDSFFYILFLLSTLLFTYFIVVHNSSLSSLPPYVYPQNDDSDIDQHPHPVPVANHPSEPSYSDESSIPDDSPSTRNQDTPSKPCSSSVHMLSSHSNPPTSLSFHRWNTSLSIVSPSTVLTPTTNSFLVLVSDQTLLVRPFFRSFLEQALDNSCESAYHDYGHNSWILVSRIPVNTGNLLNFTSSSCKFPSSSWLTFDKDGHYGYGAPFMPLKFGSDYMYQLEIEKKNNFKPIKLLVPDENLNSKFSNDTYAIVLSFMSFDPNGCKLNSNKPGVHASMVLAIIRARTNTNGRVIVLSHDVCGEYFRKLLKHFEILNVEVVEFQQKMTLPSLHIFKNQEHYRASFVMKTFYIMNINKYLSNPIDRFMSIDWDVYLMKNVDYLFHQNIPKNSILVAGDTEPTVLINGGFLISSPNAFNGSFEQFSKDIIYNYKGWTFFRKGRILKHSEQETYAYFFRKHDALYYLPLSYNRPAWQIIKWFVFGFVENTVDILHCSGAKPHSLSQWKPPGPRIVKDYLPEWSSLKIKASTLHSSI
ncbi:hypothetical protein GEMRC1_010875 [Eukaryota sp. GEM-RC1]